MYEYDYSDDVILPEGFDPNNENWTLDDGVPPVEEAPTTEPAPAEPDVPAEPAEAAPTTEPAPEALPQTITVKFNHEERVLTLDEAQALAQKGLNYDKLQERYNALDAIRGKSAKLAKDLGYASEEEMLEAAQQSFIERRVKDLVDAGNTEAMSRFLVEQEMKAQAAETPPAEQAPAEAQPAAPAPAPVQQEQPTPEPSAYHLSPERQAELNEFVKAYPGVTKLPPEVIDANRNGVRLLVAYERFLHSKDRADLAVMRQNQDAAARAPVSGVTGKAAAPAEAEDVFLKGFNADNW